MSKRKASEPQERVETKRRKRSGSLLEIEAMSSSSTELKEQGTITCSSLTVSSSIVSSGSSETVRTSFSLSRLNNEEDMTPDVLKEFVGAQKDEVLQLAGQEADTFMAILQKSLDDMHVDDGCRGQFLDLLLQLAIQTSNIPECLVINGVTDRAEFPLTGGGFGDVWKASWNDRIVALKTLRETQDKEKVHRNLCREVLLWRQLKHPNLLEFVGICMDILPSPAIVSIWMENGNIMQFVKAQSMEKKLLMLSQVANALAYLHAHNPIVIHQDVRCANILVNDTHEAILSDFGLSRLDSDYFNSFTSSLEHGCLRWQAPELVFPETFSTQTDESSDGDQPSLPKPTTHSDVYALGMTALELITEKKPFSCFAMDTAVVMELYRGQTPKRPSESDVPGFGAISDEVWTFLMSCWSKDTTKRPSAAFASEFLAEEAANSKSRPGTRSRSCKTVGKGLLRSIRSQTIVKDKRAIGRAPKTKQTARKSTGGFPVERRHDTAYETSGHAGPSNHPTMQGKQEAIPTESHHFDQHLQSSEHTVNAPLQEQGNPVQKFRVPVDFIKVALCDRVDLFEETHGVKITTSPGDDEASIELSVDPPSGGIYASFAAAKELENLIEYYWKFGMRSETSKSH